MTVRVADTIAIERGVMCTHLYPALAWSINQPPTLCHSASELHPTLASHHNKCTVKVNAPHKHRQCRQYGSGDCPVDRSQRHEGSQRAASQLSITPRNMMRRSGLGTARKHSTQRESERRSKRNTKLSANWAVVLDLLYGWVVIYSM